MPNESMVFYSSFSKAIKRLPEDEQLKALWSIIDYGIDGKEPEGDGLFMVAFDMAKPQIIDQENPRVEVVIREVESGRAYHDPEKNSRMGMV